MILRSNELRGRLAAGEALGAIWLSLGSPAAAECMAVSRPDIAVFDMQHGLWSRDSLEAGIAAVRPYTIALARTMSSAPDHIAPALEAGAAGVVIPLVESAEQARAAVSATRYMPVGSRSGGGIRPLFDFEGYVAAHRKSPPFVAAMIETREGLEAAAEIADVDGVDMVFVGTGDLALSLDTFPNSDKGFADAVEAVIEAATYAGRASGVFTVNETSGQTWRARGAQLTVLACDNDILRLGALQARQQFDNAVAPPAEPT